jgi:D-proline reductase (dithiol) PrdB
VTRLTDLPPGRAKRFAELECPDFETRPWSAGPRCRSAGWRSPPRRALSYAEKTHFAAAFRLSAIPATIAANDLLCSHISISFDRTGFQEDWNVVFPLDRLNELAAGGVIGSVADKHYSFMGATDPVHMEPYARELAGRLSRMPSTPPFFPPLDRFARAP